MKKFLLFLCFGVISAHAQTTDNDQIKATINQFFIGMATADSTHIRATLGENCSLRTIVKTKDENVKVLQEDIEKFIKSVGTKREGVLYDERIQSFDIKIDAEMAIAWTPYQFYLNNTFSHCGVNVFTLMKTKNGWKIIGIIDTRRKTDC